MIIRMTHEFATVGSVLLMRLLGYDCVCEDGHLTIMAKDGDSYEH